MISPTFCERYSIFLTGSMYRHPNETVQWNEIFYNQFDTILACEKEIYLMGDFNRDILQVNTKKTWLEYNRII